MRPPSIRYLSWRQVDDAWELSADEKSHLVDEPCPEIEAKRDGVLSQALGKQHTAFELFRTKHSELVAVSLYFENYSFAVSIGSYEWDVEKQTAEFQDFHGNDVFIWTPEQFIKCMQASPVQLVEHFE